MHNIQLVQQLSSANGLTTWGHGEYTPAWEANVSELLATLCREWDRGWCKRNSGGLTIWIKSCVMEPYKKVVLSYGVISLLLQQAQTAHISTHQLPICHSSDKPAKNTKGGGTRV